MMEGIDRRSQIGVKWETQPLGKRGCQVVAID
jgi:hypothetical protein